MINRELHYQPNGSMCKTCTKRNRDCSRLEFGKMPAISKGDSDGTVIVKCAYYERRSKL